MVLDPKFIRNFSIVAHIDHGKSTLADQLLLQSGAITQREFREQLLDDMDLERERGITIKARAVAINYELDGQSYELNLIDTPGHVDFHYEVSRSLAACEGAILLVDATQGVQAQTVANAYLAIAGDLAIVPVLNKIDMQAARPDEIREEIMATLGIDPDDVLAISAKTGLGVPDVFRAIIDRVPSPSGSPTAPLRALIFDSKFDDYQGVIIYVRVVDGVLRVGQKVRLMAGGTEHEVIGLGRFRPHSVACDELGVGQVGYVHANIKKLADVNIGDTLTESPRGAQVALPGYQEPVPVVFCGLFPATHNQFEDLRTALQKLALNDSSFSFEPETSDALGFGFRCGFLGMLHMEIVQQRLERESNLALVQTAPNVTYEILDKRGETTHVSNPTRIPDAGDIEEFREPVAKVSFILPSDSIGAIMQLCEDRRGTYLKTEYMTPTRAILTYELPLAEMIYDLYDKLKSATRGYGTMDYELIGYRASDLCRLDILVAGSKVDALSIVVHRAHADRRGRKLVRKLRAEIDRHQFEVAIQAAIGTRVVARETISALRKNVTAKCYGGDISRKRKLLEKQKEGKKRMKQIGNVEISQEAFLSVLDDGEE
ncbi:translation elongation factor 4 [Singulisphaera acidiphila]|uniref:Elongation factor 4 n=1 Tax=Singulisphaera acidiphila (strain ATCC BAA-1392 / DSM 18658 / VKM B-2454 / MOB10) TaxID=886293 RepID=L0DAG5_SINAD|nr:translation elongation factor 4 [Singulisphaera acidiphila]AGA26242.1 GTP-binding protein LepA [Singulisphaera acidiphila DSM 18658]